MAGSELIIDDVFVSEMVTYFKDVGHRLELYYGYYISEMKAIRSEAVMGGDVANAMDAFVEYAEMISTMIAEVSSEISNDTDKFMIEIDEKDDYLFDYS